MPIYMEISQLHRTVTIAARGKIDPEEVRAMAMRLVEAKVRSFAKILEVAGASSTLTIEQIDKVAALMRAGSPERRGPVAFVLNPSQIPLAQAFAERTASEGPVQIFSSLREARRWTEQILATSAFGRGSEAHPAPPVGQTAFTDPERKGVMLKGNRQREVTVRPLERA